MTDLTLRLGDRAVTARIDAAGQVHIDDTAFVVSPTGPGLYLVTDGTRRWPVAVAADGDQRWIAVAGQVAVLDLEPAGRPSARKRSPRADAMMAPMPATVVKILVEPGQSVAEGETVLVLEAMKMELPVRAARAGVVASIECAAGELVQPGVPLVELD